MLNCSVHPPKNNKSRWRNGLILGISLFNTGNIIIEIVWSRNKTAYSKLIKKHKRDKTCIIDSESKRFWHDVV